MKKLKIVNSVYGDATGGRWQAMLNMTDTLEQYGHEVILVRGEENAHLSTGEHPVTVLENRGFYSISAALRVRKWIKAQQPDVIIAHSGRGVWLFKNATIGMGIPVIAVNHSHNVKRTVRADAFIHITPHVAYLVQSLQSESARNSKPQKVISNLIHLPDEPAEPALIHQPPTILMLTRMIHTKGVHVLIEAVYQLQQKNIFVRAIIAGEGELKAQYEKMVDDYNLRDRISFPGWVDQAQKVELYHQADFIAVPSLVDIQPLGILDAFGWGKVVLSSDAIGPLQICQHQKNAWVSEVDNASSLANGIEYLIAHPNEALALARQAKKEALERYCFKQIAREHNDFVQQVVAHYHIATI